MSGRGAYRAGTLAFSLAAIALGLLMLGRTVAAGGSGVAAGYVAGAAFVAVGVLRLVILRRTG